MNKQPTFSDDCLDAMLEREIESYEAFIESQLEEWFFTVTDDELSTTA